MTGEVIQLVAFKRGQLYRQQAVPRGPVSAPRSTSIVELRVERITRLLTELEELTRLPRSVPPTTLDLARAGVEKARRIVRSGAAPGQQLADDPDGDPQPELDDERIERMYRELNHDG